MTGPERTLCVVVHDVAPPTWALCQRLLHEVAAVGAMPVTLLAVPRYHGTPRDQRFEAWLRQRASQGDEVALHGYTHLDAGPAPRGRLDHWRRRHYTAGEGEFAALGGAEAARRLKAGADWLRGLGLPPAGFVAPAWLLSDGAWQALRATPLDYTCTLRRVHLLHTGSGVNALSQVYSTRSAWRRVVSVLWNMLLAQLQRSAPCVRVELHPGDIEHRFVRDCWLRLLRRQLQSREPITLVALTRRIA
jgi:predicted deacetylase